MIVQKLERRFANMIVRPEVVDALNKQIISEFHASAQYIAIAIFFEAEGLPELAAFFYRQSDEEREHALKMVRFLLDAGASPLVSATPAVQNGFDSASEAVQLALTQELTVTDQINSLVELSLETKDHTTNQFLQWFVTEQVEEVSTMSQLLQTIKHAGSNLLMVEEYVRRNPQHEGDETQEA
jgi:ferritin